jgi:hypothetical protein
MPRPDAPLTGTQAHAHFLTGQQMECDRILKLLESKVSELKSAMEATKIIDSHAEAYVSGIESVIPLIKKGRP